MRIIQSPRLAGFPHGFTTRQGGASAAPFDTLNLGGQVGDAPERVAENWARLERATGLRFARVRQVHGTRAVRARAPCAPEEEADAVLSLAPGIAACVSVADCVPVLLADPDTGAVAAVHAGWRGTVARGAAEAVRALAAEAGAPAARLLAAVGPSIGPCCYEVSPELAARFAAELGPAVVRDGPAPRLDLWAANVAVLGAAGVPAERVEVLGRCTACERDLFFSHRRDAGRTGRQMAFIAPRPPTGGGPLP
jgi:purine-nucleoside/S-methyl-5'-thioadenosine phosphorylase / adenosine deaminase